MIVRLLLQLAACALVLGSCGLLQAFALLRPLLLLPLFSLLTQHHGRIGGSFLALLRPMVVLKSGVLV